MNDAAPRPARRKDLGFLAGGGEMGARIRAHAWEGGPLGRPQDWPQPLKTLVGVMLSADQPMFLAWGPEHLLLYNDGYAPMLADRHPSALGRPFFAVWPEVREDLVPLFDQVFAGQPVHMQDIELFLERPGRPKEAHFAFSYTPVRDEADEVVALFCPCTEITEQVLAERTRLAAAERQRLIFQQMPGFVGVLTGADHVYEYVNDAYVAISGPRDFVGRSVRQVFPELEGQGFYELLDEVYATGEPFKAKAMPIRLAGDADERFIDFLYQPIRNDAGEVTGVFVGGYDATESRRAEKGLRSAAAKERFLSELNDALIQAADPRSAMAAAVERLGDHLGATRAGYCEALGDGEDIVIEGEWRAPGAASAVGRHRLADFGAAFVADYIAGRTTIIEDVATDPRSAGTPAVAAHAELGIRAQVVVPLVQAGRLTALLFVHAGEPRRWAPDEIVLVEEAAARIWAAVERARAEAALRELNASLERQVIERTLARGRTWQVSPDMLGVLNADGDVEASNPAWASTLGWSEEEVGRTRFFDFIHPDDLPKAQAAWADAVDRAAPVITFETRCRRKGGGWRWLSWVAVPDEGEVYCSARDITAEKAREADLEQAHEALRQSQKMEAVGQLTGGIAHDFNNMLAVVIGSLDLLGRRLGAGDARARRYVDAASDGARRAALLTQRLLAFSRQQPLRPEAIDVNKLVTGMSDLIRGSLGSDIRFETVLAGGGWRTHADPNQLENVLLNLAVNARDAMPEGGRLTIETQNTHLDARYAAQHIGVPAGQYVLVAVSDTGSGMPEEVIAKAFDPFFTTKAVGKGTGLGLSQVYGFVKQSGGHVKIYSEPGQGTSVKVYLPRLIGSEEHDTDEETATDLPLGEGQEVVLVVEDEPSVRQFSVEALTELGYRVLEADGAETALRLLDAHPEITLMFTDIVMPDVNGRKLADEARHRRPGLKVLFTTGYTRNAVVHNGVLDPGVELIGKPFTIEELAAKVREVLDAPAS